MGASGSAVIATNPPSAPFNIMTTSVFPVTNLDITAHAITPAAAANVTPTGVSATTELNDELIIWFEFNTTQSPNYSNITTTQTPSWTDIDESETTNWEEVA